jgi:hypothetical protein
MLGASCGEKAPATATPPKQSMLAAPAAQPTKGKVVSNVTATPVAPADARLTLYCLAIPGIDHVAQSKMLKGQLIERTGWNDFYIIHGETESILYYGYYKDFIGSANPKEKQRAEADRAKIVSFRDSRSDRPFRGAAFVDLSTPDPEGPPEWNLANTPADRMWTLQIAVYKDSPLRKQYAVDAVREARKQGIEAYYHHGQSVSSVCIGAYPRQALREQETATAETQNSDQPIVVLPAPLPAGAGGDFYVNEGGRRVKAQVMAPRVEPVDPALLAAMKAFPHYSVNGEQTMTRARHKRTGREVQVFDPSVIVEIDRPRSALADRPQPAAPQLINPSGTSRQRGVNHLRGLED